MRVTEMRYIRRMTKPITQEAPLDSYSIRLAAWHARMARKLGKGNMGEGTRAAIEFAAKHLIEDSKGVLLEPQRRD